MIAIAILWLCTCVLVASDGTPRRREICQVGTLILTAAAVVHYWNT